MKEKQIYMKRIVKVKVDLEQDEETISTSGTTHTHYIHAQIVKDNNNEMNTSTEMKERCMKTCVNEMRANLLYIVSSGDDRHHRLHRRRRRH